MADLLRALGGGFKGGGAVLAAALYLYAAALASSWTASAPLASSLHAALDGQPGAYRLVEDGGLEAGEEMRRSSPGWSTAQLAVVPPLAVVFLPLGVLLIGGAYGMATGRHERPFSEFWAAGAERLPGFLARSALGAAYAAAIIAVAIFLSAGIAAATGEPSGPAVYWMSVGARAAVVAIAVLHARTVLGFALAFREAAPDEGFLPGFGRSLALCWRRPASTHGMGAAFIALQALAALAGFSIARLQGEGGWAGTAWAQAGWLGAAWLRVAEIRARIVFVSPASGRLPAGREAGSVAPEIPSEGAEGAACVP